MAKVCICIAMILAVVAVGCRQRTEAETHRSALAKLTYEPPIKSLGDYVSLDYLRWNLQGRPRSKDVMFKQAEHIGALIALGELERRTFVLKQRRFDVNGVVQFTALVRAAYATNALHEQLAQYYCDDADLRTITVITSPLEIKTWEKFIRSFDEKAALPNPQAGADGEQLPGSEINSTSTRLPPAAQLGR